MLPCIPKPGRTVQSSAPRLDVWSFHKLLDGLAKVVDGGLVSGLDGVHHAVADVVVQDDLAGVVDGAADGSELDQHIGAVIALLHHPLDLVQVADGPGQAIDDRLLILVDMAVGVSDAVFVHVCVVVVVIVFVIGHIPPLLPFPCIIAFFPRTRNRDRGFCWKNKCFDIWANRYYNIEKHFGGNTMHHDHHHEHTHDHHHHDHHDHCHSDCSSCASHCEHTPMEELVALMKYMVGHNASHARELADLAKQFQVAGNPMAYEQVMAAVSDFEKGNLRLSAILSSLEH